MQLPSQRTLARVFFSSSLLVGLLLLVLAFSAGRREPDTLKSETEQSASWLAGLIIGAVEHTMLQGEGIAVKQLVARLEKRVPEADVDIFDSRGIPVFAPKPPPPEPSAVPPGTRAALDSSEHTMGEDGRIYRPIANSAKCEQCHDDGQALRGILALDLVVERCKQGSQQPVAQLTREGFIHVMTAEREDLLDDYFREMARTVPVIAAAAVFDTEGDVSYGEPIAGLTREMVLEVAKAPATSSSWVVKESSDRALIPLTMQERCVACHDEAIGTTRGVLAIAFDKDSAAKSKCLGEQIEQTLETSLRFIMMSKLGRRIADFLDRAVESEWIRELVLYDNVGRVYWTTDHPTPPTHVASALEENRSLTRTIGSGEDERVQVVVPLENDPRCVRCHGSSSETRGLVAISLSTAQAAQTRQETLKRRAEFTSYVVLGVLLLLVAVLYFVRPGSSLRRR